jgi:hypothetical protein
MNRGTVATTGSSPRNAMRGLIPAARRPRNAPLRGLEPMRYRRFFARTQVA